MNKIIEHTNESFKNIYCHIGKGLKLIADIEKLPNYVQGYIYKIKSSKTNKCYIGSTTQSISKRMKQHKNDYALYLKGKCNYITSFELLKFSDAKIETTIEIKCATVQELRIVEGQHIKIAKHCVNKNIAGRKTREQWRLYNKNYYERKRDKMKK